MSAVSREHDGIFCSVCIRDGPEIYGIFRFEKKKTKF